MFSRQGVRASTAMVLLVVVSLTLLALWSGNRSQVRAAQARISLIERRITSVTQDFEKLEYISSAGLRALLLVRTTLYNSATLKIINANELVKEVFDVTGFKKIIPID